jgi:hypothetical protein
VLPAGQTSIRRLQSVAVEAGGKKQSVTLYEISGLAFTPNYLWLDDRQEFFASLSGWSFIVRHGFEASSELLRESQRQVEEARAAELAKKLVWHPQGDLVIRNVAVFDSVAGKVLTQGQLVFVGEDGEQAIPGEEYPSAKSDFDRHGTRDRQALPSGRREFPASDLFRSSLVEFRVC